jgi:5'-methylthioadenosine phosphorylase
MLAIIGGTGFYSLVEKGEEMEVKTVNTSYGPSSEITIFSLGEQELLFMPRHTGKHAIPPHKINYRANIYALKEMGVNRILATNAVGSLDENLTPGNFLIPDDFLDFTYKRPNTFYDNKTVHVDVTNPYCQNMRNLLISSGNVVDGGVYVCTEGPRFETPAEINMFKILGGTVVGMTGLPEVVLAREFEMCYASLSMVTNFAASISSDRVTIDEVFEVLEKKKQDLIKIFEKAIQNLNSEQNCSCHNALQGAEINI